MKKTMRLLSVLIGSILCYLAALRAQMPANIALASTLNTLAPQSAAQTPLPQPIVPVALHAQGEVIKPIQTPDASQEANIYLNFENASLASVINYLGEQKKINLIPHKDLENAKVTLTTRNPLTQDRAWNILLTLLEMNGFSLIKVGDIYRVVLSANNGQEPLPTYSSATGTDPEDLPDSDMIVRYVYFFKNIKTDTAKSIFAKMLDNPEKNVIDNKDLNACIIKDSSLNIKAAMRIIKELDSGGLREAIEVIPLKWANADTVKKMFDEVQGGAQDDQRVIRFTPSQKESTFFSTKTKIIAEPTKNALILLGTQDSIDKIFNFISKYIDVPIDDADSRLHVKELRYIKAQDLQPILENVLKPKGVSDKAQVLEGGYKVFEDVIIAAETDDDGSSTIAKRGGGNRLIVACNHGDWRRIEEFVNKLDKPQPQVAIEVLIVDVTLDQEKQLGAQLFGIKGKPLAKGVNIDFENLGVAGALPTPTPAPPVTPPLFFNQDYINLASTIGIDNSSFVTLGRPGTGTTNNDIWGLIKAQISLTNSQIIDQPYVIANNHQPCEVTVNVAARLAGPLDTVKSNLPVQKQESVNAATTVKITPHINEIGLVDLEIDITVNEFGPDPFTDPTITARHLITKSTMGTGEVLVLGGLIKSQLSESIYKTPILGDIPLIGSLFRSKSKSKTETNLYIFIRPSIIKPRFEGEPDEYTQLKLDYAKLQIMRNDTYVQNPDPIQRWFFKPTNQTIKQKLADSAKGILRSVDDYTYGRNRPKSVDIQDDKYYKVSESIEKEKIRREEEKKRHEQSRHQA